MSFVFSGTGGCLCGAIRYECHGVPYAAALCHCRNCQKAHAAAFAPLLFVPPETVTFVKGRVSRHEMVAESGAKMFRDFCRECGSPLFSGGAAFPRLISVKMVNLDAPGAVSPIAHIWAESRVSWGCVSDGLPVFRKQPPLDELVKLWVEKYRGMA
jgi:hypothetical protein